MNDSGVRGGSPGENGLAAARIGGAILTVCLTLFLLTGMIWGLATSGDFLEREMIRFAPPERTGIPLEVYPSLGAHLADGLAGRKDSFQFYLTGADGSRLACFHEYELIHLADCRGLIRLDGIVCLICLACSLLCGGWLAAGGWPRLREAWRGTGLAARLTGILAAGLVLWAAVNFDGLFITFHLIAFQNDYWLLNPRTDLLIRLMPQAMFVHMGLIGGGCFAAGMGLMWIGARMLHRRSLK